jgi:hypothetical protein
MLFKSYIDGKHIEILRKNYKDDKSFFLDIIKIKFNQYGY